MVCEVTHQFFIQMRGFILSRTLSSISDGYFESCLGECNANVELNKILSKIIKVYNNQKQSLDFTEKMNILSHNRIRFPSHEQLGWQRRADFQTTT